MPPDSDTDTDEPVVPAEERVRPRAADYLWRPWYAKLWWAAIPTYWLGMAVSSFVPVLGDFFASALAGFLNVLFYPFIALLVLGAGFARAWLDCIEWGGESRAVMHDELFRRPHYDPYTDPGNPLSGAFYRSRINRETDGNH